MRTREEFLAERKSGIGGSDISAIVGISPWRTPRDVWADKTGKTPDREETPAMYWGTVLEDIVAREFAKRTGMKIQRCNFMLRHPDKPFLVANVDRVVYVEPHKKPVGKNHEILSKIILECKTASAYAAAEWGTEESGKIPEHYFAQVQWYMGVAGAEVCYVAVLIGSNDFRVYKIDRDDTVIKFLFAEGERFWHEFVFTDIMPPPKVFADTERAFPNAIPKSQKYASDDMIALCGEYERTKQESDAITAKLDNIKMKICEYIGDNTDLLNTENKKLCSWSAPGIRTVIDWKAVAEDAHVTDEIIAKHTKNMPIARRFTFPKIKTDKE